jgi:L-ascorbate metabolism protein UlaG (beta-lactamase superfamily)
MKITSICIPALLMAGLLSNQSCSSANNHPGGINMNKIEKSDHYKDGKFFNYQNNYEINYIKTIPILWDFLFKDNNRKPDVQLPTQSVDFKKITTAGANELKVTWIGHSSQIINLNGKIILTDPVFENKTAFMGPARYNGDVPLNMEKLPEIDLVLISHNHYDHLNATTIETIHPRVKHFIAPLMVGPELENMGVPAEKITELDWWDEKILFDEFLIALTPAQHFSNRGLFDSNETLWGSFVIKGPHHKIYYSGDSGYFDGFKQIGDKYGPFDYTFLECGAYDERWHAMHMMPEETAQAHLDLKGKILQPIHWGTFDLALHSWYDPIVRVAKAADSLGIRLSTPIVGETILIDDNLLTERWWEPLLNNTLVIREE